jgi:hypothetical protein
MDAAPFLIGRRRMNVVEHGEKPLPENARQETLPVSERLSERAYARTAVLIRPDRPPSLANGGECLQLDPTGNERHQRAPTGTNPVRRAPNAAEFDPDRSGRVQMRPNPGRRSPMGAEAGPNGAAPHPKGSACDETRPNGTKRHQTDPNDTKRRHLRPNGIQDRPNRKHAKAPDSHLATGGGSDPGLHYQGRRCSTGTSSPRPGFSWSTQATRAWRVGG